jgi:FlaA1/EpsC-like NDP-sugar epimerase
MLWLKRPGEAGDQERVVLYGSGLRAELYLRDRAMRITKQFDGRLILGFIDDEKSLHYQWVYGFLVLGGLRELPQLIERRKINRIIIVSDLLPECRVAVRELAAQHGVLVSEWDPEEHTLPPAQH